MSDWIKCSDKMPDKDERYLVVEKHPWKWVGICAMRNGRFDFEITHWQELPGMPDE